MHDHHPRYDRPDIGVRKPGKVILPEEKNPERRGSKRLNVIVLMLLFGVGMTVLYYTVKDWRFKPPASAAPVNLIPQSR